MYGISESGLLLWLGETHAISQRSILQPTRVIIAQHVARRLATFSKKQSVTKSRTILDIFIVLKVFFFPFSRFCMILYSFGHICYRASPLHWSMRKTFPQQTTKRATTRWNVACVWLDSQHPTTRSNDLSIMFRWTFGSVLLGLFNSIEPVKIANLIYWTWTVLKFCPWWKSISCKIMKRCFCSSRRHYCWTFTFNYFNYPEN